MGHDAQETYEVFGQMKMGPAGGCPAELHGKKARIKCSEGDIFELPADAVALSLRARKDLLEKGCDQELDYPLLGLSLSYIYICRLLFCSCAFGSVLVADLHDLQSKD